MNIYSVVFFGHRQITDYFETEKKLQDIIRTLLREHEYVEFLVGRNGEFDTMAASAVRIARREYCDNNSALVLVLPYATAEFRDNEKEFYNYYDEIEICDEASVAHFKSSIGIRNRKMVERADCVVCCIEHEYGGAYTAVCYAKSLGKRILYIN
ncbi:MAG: hypothetical protein IJ299_05060 [Oscillospiraceae bacterium]|nr:hypothetical protein [Oscillospiraceae bacterium]